MINIMSNVNNMDAYGGVVSKPLNFNIKPNLPDGLLKGVLDEDE